MVQGDSKFAPSSPGKITFLTSGVIYEAASLKYIELNPQINQINIMEGLGRIKLININYVPAKYQSEIL